MGSKSGGIVTGSTSTLGTTPLQQSVYDLGTPMTNDSVKRRGRPRGWTDARIRLMLAYLEENFAQFQTGKCGEFYTQLAIHLGDEVDQAEVREKLEKMVKQFDLSKRRQDHSWKWYRKMNQIFRGAGGLSGGPPGVDDSDSLDCSLTDSDDFDIGGGVNGGGFDKLPKLEDGNGEGGVHDDENGGGVHGEDGSAGDLSVRYVRLRQKYAKLHYKYAHRYRDLETQLKKALVECERLRSRSEMQLNKLERDITATVSAASANLAMVGAGGSDGCGQASAAAVLFSTGPSADASNDEHMA